jgi:hypothetical protein
MTLELYWQHHRHFDLNCQSDASKFNRNYETASNSCIRMFDTTVNSQLNIFC